MLNDTILKVGSNEAVSTVNLKPLKQFEKTLSFRRLRLHQSEMRKYANIYHSINM